MNINNKIKIEKKVNFERIEGYVYKVRLYEYKTIYYMGSIGNCKHCTLQNIGGISDDETEIFFKELEKFLITKNKLCFTINVTDKRIVQKFVKKFVLIHCAELPIGYGNGIQYHATFFTNNNYCDKELYLKRVKKQKKLIS